MRLRTPAVAALLLAFLLAGAGLATAVTTSGQPASPAPAGPAGPSETIRVSDTGAAQAAPDQAVVVVEVAATAPDAPTARIRLAENVSRMRTALAEAGVGDDQIRTERYDLGREHRRRPPTDDAASEPRYRGTHSFAITVADIDATGTVLDTAVSNGADSVRDVRFRLSEDRRAELRRDALRDAVENARDQATTLADAANLDLVGVHAIDSRTGGAGYRPVAASADGASTDIEQGPVAVEVHVDVTFNATAA